MRSAHKRRIKTEEKAMVVAAVWWEEFIQFNFLSNQTGAIRPIIQNRPRQNS